MLVHHERRAERSKPHKRNRNDGESTVATIHMSTVPAEDALIVEQIEPEGETMFRGRDETLQLATNSTDHTDVLKMLNGHKFEVQAGDEGADADVNNKGKLYSRQQQHDWNKKQRYKYKSRRASGVGLLDA